jgi:hypothetical protein
LWVAEIDDFCGRRLAELLYQDFPHQREKRRFVLDALIGAWPSKGGRGEEDGGDGDGGGAGWESPSGSSSFSRRSRSSLI